ncbi:MAG: hypothetical protein GTO40_27505, partial [Deltaproteobacteria bacterium]|nr:hypothetical protein [Deltaproteobacteria bacterium]
REPARMSLWCVKWAQWAVAIRRLSPFPGSRWPRR